MTNNKPNELNFHSIGVCTSNEIKGNFIRLPSPVVHTLETTGIPVQEFGVTITKNGSNLLHVGWDGYESRGYLNGQPTIEISPILAQEMKIHAGVTVDLSVSKFGEKETATEVYVEPVTSDDWEIIESHAMFFQDEILHQTRIMTIGETLLCYIDNVVSKFKVKKIVPTNLSSARINTGSLIVISPRENKSRTQQKALNTQTESKKLNTPSKGTTSTNLTTKRSLCDTDGRGEGSMEIFLHSKEALSKFALISLLHSSLDLKQHAKQEKPEKPSKFAKRIAVAVRDCDDVPKGHISMTPLVWNALWTEPQNGCKLNVEFVDGIESYANTKKVKILFRPVIEDDERLSKVEKQRSVQGSKQTDAAPKEVCDLAALLSKGPVTDRMLLAKEHIFVELVEEASGRHVTYVNFENSSPTNWSFSALNEVRISPQLLAHVACKKEPSGPLGGNSWLPTIVAARLIKYLTMPVTPSNGMLLVGNAGMGKTTVLKEVSRELTLKHQIYVKYVDCNSLLDSLNIGKMKQSIQELCSLCYWHSPSVLILDNAQSLFPSIKSDDPQQQSAQQRGGSTSTKLALFLINLVGSIGKKWSGAFKVVFASPNKNELNSIFFDKHLICETFQRKAPDVDERGRLIEFFFQKLSDKISLTDDLEYRDIALDTDGYSPLDLRIVVDKLFYQSTMNMARKDDVLIVNKQSYMETINSFSPSSLRGVKMTKSTGTSWKDIGALSGPKQLLLETLEWPTKYAPIFKNCPLQLRSGVLLYGYPGCGKTLLASAVAQQCGLNFITVNGPEILNKYIGASEQNVRELFERAQSVKPCILFFDEFDSIAPKRGHDSTGVTDRIVNQLLTQMDGVEGLDGVYVLAATSRPDLIDSALLRPGRIDKSVLCDVPDENDRLDILKTITSNGKMKLEPGTDLSTVIAQTSGYSGADLQSLCYNAYLKSAHRELLAQEEGKQENNVNSSIGIEFSIINERKNLSYNVIEMLEEQKAAAVTTNAKEPKSFKASTTHIEIKLQDLLKACQETKPSISTTEFHKLQSIYQKFQNARDGNMPHADSSTDVGTRTSLM